MSPDLIRAAGHVYVVGVVVAALLVGCILQSDPAECGGAPLGCLAVLLWPFTFVALFLIVLWCWLRHGGRP